MAEFTLYIGDKAYSSWSLRGWLACRLAGIDFDEVLIRMYQSDTAATMRRHSPSSKVPALHHRDLVIWESLAIGEYLAELVPAAGLWPAERARRAHARSISCEMHAGFTNVRKSMWMNLRRRFPGRGRNPETLADIARVSEIWCDTRQRFGAGGPFLFGDKFSLADAMYAPVVARFVTWEPPLADDAKTYVEAVWSHPLVAEWRRAAEADPILIDHYETPGP